MECLLSYIEFTQYQQYLINNFIDELNQNIVNKINIVSFPSNVPISSIISTKQINDNPVSENKMKAFKLYKKYIECESEYEINISGEKRKKLDGIFGNVDNLINKYRNINNNDLLKCFNDSKETMKLLMLSSFHRFKQSDEFAQVQQIFRFDL